MTKLSKPLIAASAFVIATAAFAQPPRELKSGLADVHGDTGRMSARASTKTHRETMTKSAKRVPEDTAFFVDHRSPYNSGKRTGKFYVN